MLLLGGLMGVPIMANAGTSAAGVKQKAARPAVTATSVRAAEALYGLSFSRKHLQEMLPLLRNQEKQYRALRAHSLSNGVPMALVYLPEHVRIRLPGLYRQPRWGAPPTVPKKLTEHFLAYATVGQLERLIHERRITALELTRFFIKRLNTYGPRLHALITLTEPTALAAARRVDRMLATGKNPGPLAGIPYGIKDIYAVKGYRTTWGAKPYEHQTIDATATVAQRLRRAGAILVAKLSTGALAMGDVWYGGKTRNPWNLGQGSSGSSAGPAAAVSAGLVPFAIGTETLGSIISPATRVGDVGLRPTFGRVSRYGVMALAYSMDKPGVLCRDPQDCARVFSIIEGYDPQDPTTVDAPFDYAPRRSLKGVRIGYLKAAFEKSYPGRAQDRTALAVLRKLGATLVPIRLPSRLPVKALELILAAEAGASFQHLTLSGGVNAMVRQGKYAWPNVFRAAQFIPAGAYINANRYRSLLVREMEAMMETQGIKVYVAPSLGYQDLLITNLTGQPAVAVPDGFKSAHEPTTLSFIGALYQDAAVLQTADAYWKVSPFRTSHPPLFP